MKTKVFLLVALTVIGLTAQGQIIRGKSNPVTVDVKGIDTKPTITWIAPEQASLAFTGKKYTVKAGIKAPAKLKNLELYVNNRPVGADRGLGVAAGSETDFDKMIDKEIDLANGLNELKIVAVDERGGSATSDIRTINATLPALASSQRTDYALIVATDDYDEWEDLTNPVFDANTIGQELQDHYGYKIEKLLNPTTGQIMTKIREYGKKQYNPGDQLFIFIAGHGQFDEVFADGYIVGKNSKLNDEAKESYISHSNLRTVVANIPSNHIFLVMDVCCCGTFDRGVAKRGQEDAMYNELNSTEFVDRKLRFKTRLYVTSGGKNYVQDGRQGAHSPFARKFLEALRNYGGRDRILTTQEIFSYLETLPMEPHRGEVEGNEPGSDFLFV